MRYQECSLICKIWRHRWTLTIPFITIYKYLTRAKVYKDEVIDEIVNGKTEQKIVHTDEYERMTLKLCWKITVGENDMKMKHYYTTEEVFNKIKF